MKQLLHHVAFLLVALAMGLAMAPLIVGICLDAYLVGFLIIADRLSSVIAAALLFVMLGGLWFALPSLVGKCNRRN